MVSSEFITALDLIDNDKEKTDNIIKYIYKNRHITKEVTNERRSTILHLAVELRPNDYKLFKFLINLDKSMLIKTNEIGETVLHLIAKNRYDYDDNDENFIDVVKLYVKNEPRALCICSDAGFGNHDIPLVSAIQGELGYNATKLLLVKKEYLPPTFKSDCLGFSDTYRSNGDDNSDKVRDLIIKTYYTDNENKLVLFFKWLFDLV